MVSGACLYRVLRSQLIQLSGKPKKYLVASCWQWPLSLLALVLVAHVSHARIIDLHTEQEITEQMLVERLRTQDVVLLGELHDNAQHHALRAGLISQIKRDKLSVIAEYLPSGVRVKRAGALLSDLEAAGFDAKGWQWPLHSPLFDAVLAANMPLIGGNLPKGFSRQLFEQGESALPAPMARAYQTASLNPEASRHLDQDLIDGHCGKLPDKYLQPMRLVQRATDLSMAQALLDHAPSVLLAGNSHVRKDYGVPQALAALTPALKHTAVGFYEADTPREELVKSLRGRYDIVWISEPAERSDPCENFKIK